jgi:hypothetical protein
VYIVYEFARPCSRVRTYARACDRERQHTRQHV